MVAVSRDFALSAALRPLTLILVVAAAVLVPLDTAARAATPPLIPHSLVLPARVFGPHVRIHKGGSGNQAADRASGLHSAPLAQLGRLTGVLETASWSVTAGAHRRSHAFSLQYEASIFESPEEAAAATADARASLWEFGSLIHLPGAVQPTFTVDERRGTAETSMTGSFGPVGWELRLRSDRAVAGPSRTDALKRFLRAGIAARNRIHGLVVRLSPTLQRPSLPPLPSVEVAPAGTGPVIKSPSLMVVNGADIPSPAVLDWGTWRPKTPQIAMRAIPTVSLAPAAGLSRYTHTAVIASGGLYDAATLYPSPAAADAALGSLEAVNDAKTGLQPVELASFLQSSPYLRIVDASAAWQGDGQVIVALRCQNVLLVLASEGETVTDLAPLAGRLAASVPTPLHAEGTQVVDAAGQPYTLQGLNWYGFEQQDFVAGGLDYRAYGDILQSIKLLGYNSIRLPFSNQLVEQNPVVTAHLRANPELVGLHALDIMDRIIQMAGALGLSVILDNHRSDAGWSAEENGLWYTAAYSDSAWVQDWTALAQRYATSDAVIGVDLRNEPHGAATWGDGNLATDWRLAAERGGNAVLAANPHLLILVEGVQFYQNSPSYWWGGNLMGVQSAPVVLKFADGSPARSQLVYSPHDYGPDNCGAGCPWFNTTTSYASLAQLWDEQWGYIVADPSAPYAAPVWLTEFGTCNNQANCVVDSTPGSQGQWFSSLTQYILAHNLGWSYWSVNGTQSTAPPRVYGNVDWYGLFAPDWSAPLPILQAALHGLQQG